ncbi:MAG: hypothetical protein AAGE86_00100 [Pseudomonadota bacterium]
MIRKIRRAAIAALALLTLSACEETRDCGGAATKAAEAERELPKLGLMTSLPIYWSIDADISNLAQGNGEKPWQRELLEKQFELVPLDTLSTIPGLSPDDPETDPLAGLERLAVIQPRGLSPADNVALDDWVRGGGELLLVLDPILSGDYDVALGDPRLPVKNTLIPPLVERWGLKIGVRFHETWEAGIRSAALGDGEFVVVHGGELEVIDPAAADCRVLASATIARCAVGKGVVTLLADAALFEHSDIAGEEGEHLKLVLDFAFP